MRLRSALLAFALAGISAAIVAPAGAAPLRSGFGGPEGYGELSQLPSDDGSSNLLNLPFAVNFYGQTYDKFYVNNNGNISFGEPVETYTPQRFPVATQPIVAPYWADVDTSNQPGGGAVYVAAPNANSVVVTWHNVGYYDANNDKLNDFQLTLLNRADTGAGNFDIEFRYNKLQWTTGDASQGSGGLGGIKAQAGYDAGDGQHFFVLPGSFTDAVLNLANTSNVSQNTPGVWTMAIRNGGTSDGSSPDAPLLPEIVDAEGFHFEFDVELNERVFIDPEVAVGYEYRVTSGPNMLTVLLPTLAGDTDGYDLFGLDGKLLGHVNGGEIFDFGGDGLAGFRVGDIDGGLDPADTQAFVTGLTFAGAGHVSMIQKPLTVNTDTEVPEPSALMLLGLGGWAAFAARRARRQRGTRA